MNALSEAINGTQAAGARPDVERIFRAHYRGLARIIAKVIRDPGRAEEIAVEVCLRWSVSRIGENEHAERWLYRAAVRMALNELRHRMRRDRYERLFSFGRRPPTPEETLAGQEQQGRVRHVLATIGRRHAGLLVLRSHGFSYEELAASLSLNPASVGTFLKRAQQAFRKEYTRRYGTRPLESR